MNAPLFLIDGVRVRVHKYEETCPISSHENDRWAEAKKKVSSAEPVEESGRLFVRNLWYSVTQEDLEELFSEIGLLFFWKIKYYCLLFFFIQVHWLM